MVHIILRGNRSGLRSRIPVCFVFILLFTLLIILIQHTTTWNISRLILSDYTPESRVVRECAQFPTKEKINWDRLYYIQDLNKNKSLIWCQVPKAGSSTLVRVFLRLASIDIPEHPDTSAPETGEYHIMLRKLYPTLSPEVMAEKLNTTFKFVVVRHPFDRILSAYRDKLESCSWNPAYCEAGKPMVKQPVENGTYVEPTFPEFVTYLLETSPETFDVHWMPISGLCAPCNIQYDAVVKLENFDMEIQVPLRQAGIDEEIVPANRRGTNGSGIERYFQQLSLTQIQKLYQVYRKDFVLFGYTPDKYFSMVVHETAEGNSTLAPTLQPGS